MIIILNVMANLLMALKCITDYRELLRNKDIDAVLISTPDHTHAMIGVAAARAKKHIYMQKPASLTIEEGRIISDVVQKSGVKFQIGSQQRSTEQFRYAAELVRNGRIGTLKTVYVGLPGDPPGGNKTEMPVPKNLNYDMWLASTPWYITQKIACIRKMDMTGRDGCVANNLVPV